MILYIYCSFRDETGKQVEELMYTRELVSGFEKLHQLALLRKEQKE
jgi:hypothetical protein